MYVRLVKDSLVLITSCLGRKKKKKKKRERKRMSQAMRASFKEPERIRYGLLAHKEERGLFPTSSGLGTSAARDVEFVASVRFPILIFFGFVFVDFESAPSWMFIYFQKLRGLEQRI